ncbi:hypothetical protein RMATCC62417_09499 [Rhizopus microsporus]|nr:hypothetical protein RMATCC62417_09499 [Rhizopus microsporus]
MGSVKVGPGIWRCNPFLMGNRKFRSELTAFCSSTERHLPAGNALQRWNHFKVILKNFIQSFSNKQLASRRHTVNSLQQRRQQLLRRSIDSSTSVAIAAVDSEPDKHYQDSASILALRSGHKWRELRERSNAYFYKCLKDRQQQQAISKLVTADDTMLSAPEELTNCAKGFYSKLYSTQLVSSQAADSLLSQHPDITRLADSQQTLLLTEWADDEIETCLSHTPSHRSLGIDGLPYEVLRFLFQQSFCRSLFCDVLNTALTEHLFPATWQRSVITLLPKKEDRRHLKNWRPISLISADAKVFTRLLAN